MRFSEKKVETKVLEKVSIEIVIKQVELSTLVHNLEEFIKNVHSLCKNIWNVESFTKENQDSINKIQEDLKSIGYSLSMDANSRSIHFNRLTFSQGRLAELMAKDRNIR